MRSPMQSEGQCNVKPPEKSCVLELQNTLIASSSMNTLGLSSRETYSYDYAPSRPSRPIMNKISLLFQIFVFTRRYIIKVECFDVLKKLKVKAGSMTSEFLLEYI